MRKKIRNTLIALFAIVFLVETTGVAVFIHSCHGSNTTGFSLNSPSPTCCCGEESNTGSSMPALSAPDCCKNEIKYIKASYTGFPVFDKITMTVFEAVCSSLVIDPVQEEVTVLPVNKPAHSPPRSGIDLIVFIHQIRIPFPVC